MSLAHAIVVKVTVGTVAAAVLVGGVSTVSVRRQHTATPAQQVSAGAGPMILAESAGTDAEVVVDPVAGTVQVLTRGEGAGAGAAGGASAKGGPAALGEQRRSPGAPVGPSRPAAGQAAVSVGGSGGFAGPTGASATVKVPSGGSETTPSDSAGSGTTSPDGSGNGSPTPGPAAPTPIVPAAPTALSGHSQGSFTVAVPGTGRISKELCLSGTAANRCQTITVPAVRPVDVTVAYSGNTGAQAPTFTPASCPGGVLVKVAGLTPGATLTLTVNGTKLSATVPERGAQQTASLCDA